MRASRPAALAGASAALLAACSSSPAATPRPGTTIEMQADYLSYDEHSLVADAALIVEGTALASETRLFRPGVEGSTPEENPLLGLTDEEKDATLAASTTVPATAVSLRVDVVHAGAAQPGDVVTIVQTTHVVRDVVSMLDSEVPLEVAKTYLLFVADDLEGTYSVLGGSAGTYVDAGDGTFSAVAPDQAPFDTLTSAEVSLLVP